MTGIENRTENDLFFACAVIEYLGRITKNTRSDIVKSLGKEQIAKLIELADVLHCEPMEAVADRLIAQHNIKSGSFDNVAHCKYTVPSHFDIAKVYKRLIAAVSKRHNMPLADAVVLVYTSWISNKIDNYNSSMYYENPEYIFVSFEAGQVLAG